MEGHVSSRNDLSIFSSLGTGKKVKPVLFSFPALREEFREHRGVCRAGANSSWAEPMDGLKHQQEHSYKLPTMCIKCVGSDSRCSLPLYLVLMERMLLLRTQLSWFANLHTPHLSYLHGFKGLSTYLDYVAHPNVKIYRKSREFTTYSD